MGPIQSSTVALREVLSRDKLVIPPFQRDYSWKKSQWEELWGDIANLAAEPESHYLGYLILQGEKATQHSFNIVDGQQRLTTLSLLMLAIISILHQIGGKENADELLRRYIITINASTLKPDLKLALNRKNMPAYSSIAQNLKPLAGKKVSSSVKNLSSCFKFFQSELKKLPFCQEDNKSHSKHLAKLGIDIGDRLLFTEIISTPEADEYRLFETLNSRGVGLSVADLLKNHLFSKICSKPPSQKEADSLEDEWRAIERNAGKEDFLKNLIAIDWNRRNHFQRKPVLYKAISKSVTTRNEARNHLDALHKTSVIYAALNNKEADLWKESRFQKISEAIDEITHLNDTFRFVAPLGILVNAVSQHKDGNELLPKLIKIMILTAIRYNIICNLQANRQEIGYSNIALKLSNGSELDLERNFSDFNVDNDLFKSRFLKARYKTEKEALYILSALEKYSNAQFLHDEADIVFVATDKDIDSWRETTPNLAEEIINSRYMLGNAMLLEKDCRRTFNEGNLAARMRVLQQSKYVTTRRRVAHDMWNFKAIEERQNNLLDIALKAFHIDWAKA